MTNTSPEAKAAEVKAAAQLASVTAQVAGVLADWTSVRVKRLHGPIWSISASYKGASHSGATREERPDPVELARYMDAAAKSAKAEPNVEATDLPSPDSSSEPDPPAGPAVDPVDYNAIIADLRAQLAAKAPLETPEQITEGVEKIVAKDMAERVGAKPSEPKFDPHWGEGIKPAAPMASDWLQTQMPDPKESIALAKDRLWDEYNDLLNKSGGGFAKPEEAARLRVLSSNLSDFKKAT